MPLDTAFLDGATNGNPYLRQLLQNWMRLINAHMAANGFTGPVREESVKVSATKSGPSKNKPLPPKNAKAPPPPATFGVTALDGHFYVLIINPDQSTQPESFVPLSVPQYRRIYRRPIMSRVAEIDYTRLPEAASAQQFGRSIIHQLQSALDTNFDSNSSVVTYGPSEQTHWDITDKVDETRFWRLRSRYRNSGWNDWRFFIDPTTCGAQAVASGRLSSSSSVRNMVTNTTNNARVDSIDAGTNATIRVYGPPGVGSVWGRVEVVKRTLLFTNFPALTITGQPYDTTLWVFYDGVNPQVVNAYYLGLQDNWAFAGKVHTVLGGGTGGINGGGGSSGDFAGGHLLRS